MNYIAILEEASPDTAVGVWFPDMPGCYSAGDTLDEAIANARSALALHVRAMEAEGMSIPRARTLVELRRDPDVKDELDQFMVAVIPLEPSPRRTAAE